MKTIRAWVQGKPPFLAFFSLLCATGAHDVEEVLSERKSYKLYGHELPEHPGETWLALYRKPFAIHKFLGELAHEFSTYGDQANLIAYSLLKIPRVTKSPAAKNLQQQWEELPTNEREELVKFCVCLRGRCLFVC